VTGLAEERAIIKSIRKSRKTANWQQAEEGALFEQECADFLGVKYGILTNSGSSAGLLALGALELPKGSEVIISACTFPTIFNIILQCGLVPVVVDAKVGTYNFDVGEVAAAITKKTKAIIAIHACGNPVDMPALMKVARKHKLYVIEDNCDGFGSTIGKRKVGAFGDLSITSFHAAHIVSMGVGGGVFTSNAQMAKRVRMYRDWGRQANVAQRPNTRYPNLPRDYNPRFIYEKIGYNFQILELQAAMGRVQLRNVGKIKQARQRNFRYLTKHLARYRDIILPKVVEDADVCWFALPLTYMGKRSQLIDHLEQHGIETRSMFAGNIICHPAYRGEVFSWEGNLQGADTVLEHSFWVSVHPRLTKSDLKYMCQVFDTFFK
jgi:CDP-4-dehydro-6-deoxyglucose reductase, E1